jgi:hypothetical protein
MPCERCQQESEPITGRGRQWLIDADVPGPDFREVGRTDPLASRTEPGRSRKQPQLSLAHATYLRGDHTEVKSLV